MRNFAPIPSKNDGIKTQPYEKRLFCNVNGGSPFTSARWEATGEYIPNATFNPSTNEWENNEEKVVTGYFLVKGSKLSSVNNNNVSILNDDSSLNINGRIRIKHGNNSIIIGKNNTNDIETISATLDLNGFPVQTKGNTKVNLNRESTIRVSKGEEVFLEGGNNTYVKVKLENDLEGNFDSVLELLPKLGNKKTENIETCPCELKDESPEHLRKIIQTKIENDFEKKLKEKFNVVNL